jgi:hypothetical protein
MKWSGSRATYRSGGIIGFTAITSVGNSAGTTGKTVMMIDKTIIATTIPDKMGLGVVNWPGHIESLTMKKLTIVTSLFSILAGVMLTSCASDEPVTQSTTTTRQTTVTQPAATQTTTTHTTGY